MEVFIEWMYKEELASQYDDLITRSIASVLECEIETSEVELSVSIVDNKEIHGVNLEQRGIDRATDVLSFPMLDYNKDESLDGQITNTFPNPETGLHYLGDMVISWDKVIEQSEAYGHTLERELSFLVVHSVLHLLGYDHMNPADESLMLAKQKEIMTKLGLSR